MVTKMAKKAVTKPIKKGITKYGKNLYRSYIKLGGVTHTEYFKTRALAEAHYNGLDKIRRLMQESGCVRTCKASNAKNQELPVGVFESPNSRQLSSGETVIYECMTASLTLNGKYHKTFTAAYGRIRSREEAITIVMEKGAHTLRKIKSYF